MSPVRILSAAVALLLVGSTAHAQFTIYSDSFSGGGAELNGLAPEVDNYLTGGNVWTAPTGFLDDGTANSGHGSALLPFKPQYGTVYEMSATLTNVNTPNTVGDWVAFGFAVNASSATSNQNRFSNAGAVGYAWMLTRNWANGNDQEFFAGPTTSGASGTAGDIVDPTQPVDMKIILDTTSLTWTAEYFLNGVSNAVVNLPASANTDIAFAGFSRSRSSTTNIPLVDDFLLSRTGPAIIPGDVDASQVVDMADFTPILDNFFENVTTRTAGDLSGDGFVDFVDFREWKDAFGGDTSAAEAAIAALGVPEPSTVALFGMGAAALVAVRLRRRKA